MQGVSQTASHAMAQALQVCAPDFIVAGAPRAQSIVIMAVSIVQQQ